MGMGFAFGKWSRAPSLKPFLSFPGRTGFLAVVWVPGTSLLPASAWSQATPAPSRLQALYIARVSIALCWT